MNNDELLRQIADQTSDPNFILGLSALPNPDEVLRKAGLSHLVYDQVLTDGHVISKVIDRRSGLLRREWIVAASGDSPGEKKAAELCNLALAAMEEHAEYPLENSLGCLQEAALRGHRALEVVWGYGGGLWLPEYLRDIPNRRLTHTGIEWRLLTIDEQNYGVPFPDKKVLMATHMAHADNPYGEALLSRCYWPYMFKHSGLKWWVTLAEKHGIPWIVARLGGSAEEPQRRDLLGKLVALAVDAITVLPKEAEIDIKGLAGVNPDVHAELIKVCNAEISKVLVGQTLSTELDQKGGSRAATETHSELRGEIVEADGKLVARVMNRLFAWITELNLGPAIPAPKFKWVDEDVPPTAWALVADKAIKAMPGKVPRRWAWEKFGIPEEMAGEEMVAVPAKPPALGTGRGEKSFALTDKENGGDDDTFTEEQQALEALAERSIEEAVAALADNEAKILDAVQGAASYEEAMDKLLALFPDLDVRQLDDVLARTLLAADMFGRYTVKEETRETSTGERSFAPTQPTINVEMPAITINNEMAKAITQTKKNVTFTRDADGNMISAQVTEEEVTHE
jgi:phage gp29-like protein